MHKQKHKPRETLKQMLLSPDREIPEWDEDCYRQTKERLKTLIGEIRDHVMFQKEQAAQADQETKAWRKVKAGLLVDQYARLKRFLLIYLDQRYRKIEGQFWRYGGNILESENKHLAEHEKSYLINYKNLIQDYSRKWNLDLTCELAPPLQSIVQVRVLQECGEITNQNEEVVRLTQNSVHYLPRRLVQLFILQGKVQIIR